MKGALMKFPFDASPVEHPVGCHPSTLFGGLPALTSIQAHFDPQPLSQFEILESLIRIIRAKDPRIHEHGSRTAQFAVALGRAIDLSGAELVHLHFAALFHDIGKLALPEELLHKEGPLTSEEYELVQCHPRSGAELLAGIPFLHTPALWIAHHHERWDGSGYPYGLRGLHIPLGSRILAVADLFDALLSESSSRPPQGTNSVLNLLRVVAGSQLDPMLVERFVTLSCLPKWTTSVEQEDDHDEVNGHTPN
ncbi:MAG: phosphohydrolase [Nitrospiraceae bacterium]